MKKILLVDDEPEYVKIASLRLKLSGYHVVVAVDGEDALVKAKETSPDLILLDIKLPKMNGFEVFRILKNDPYLSKIPVIFASADASIKISTQAPEFGAVGYLVKPFEHEDLLKLLRTVLV